MNVLVFTSAYPNNIWPNNGVFVKERISYFSRLEGCEVKVVAPVPYFPPLKFSRRWIFSQVEQQEIIDGIEVHHPRYFMTPKIGMVIYGLLMFFSVLPYMRKIYKEWNFDLISAHTVYPEGFAGVLLGAFFHKPVVVSARGTDINLLPKFHLTRQLIKYTLQKAERVISVCQALKEEMIQLGIPEDKISVIPNGVDQEKFSPVPQEDARRKLALPLDKTILLSVGELIPRKGFDLLIQALKILIEKQRETRLYLVIAGEGSYRQELEKLILSLHLEQHVLLTGALPHNVLYLWYSAADLFCLASSREGWPNVLMESLACGTPVVATDVWGVPEIVQSEEIGFLTKRSAQDIATGIALALKKPWQVEAILHYIRECTWERVALSVLHTFEAALKG